MPLFLLNRYAFHYNPTTVTLLQSKQRKKRPKVAVLADAFQETGSEIDKSVQLRLRTGWTFEPLFYSKIEAGQIKRCAARCDTFLRNNASEEMFKKIAKGYDILHIASHAFIDTLFDNFSGLILALPDRTNQDGILMAFEIDEQQLNCELVTLSACETGRGDFVHGEGVLGLPRHFQIAGAQSVIMSHWKVEDQFTAHLMPLFYRLYLKDGLSISKALQQAKLLATSGTRPRPFDYRHPFFWASFSLYGDMGKPAKKTPLLFIGLGILILLYASSLLILSRYKKKKISVIRP